MAIYTDLSFGMKKHPFTSDLFLKTDTDAVKQALLNLLMTRPGEKLFEPDFGCGIQALLFENLTHILSVTTKRHIENQIAYYEKRVKLVSVILGEDPETNSLTIDLQYYVVNIPKLQSLSLSFKRLR